MDFRAYTNNEGKYCITFELTKEEEHEFMKTSPDTKQIFIKDGLLRDNDFRTHTCLVWCVQMIRLIMKIYKVRFNEDT